MVEYAFESRAAPRSMKLLRIMFKSDRVLHLYILIL